MITTISCSKPKDILSIENSSKTQETTEVISEDKEPSEPVSDNVVANLNSELKISEIPPLEMKNNSTGVKYVDFTVTSATGELDCRSAIKAESSNEKVLSSRRIEFSGKYPNCRAFIIGNPGESGLAQLSFIVSNGNAQAKSSFSVTVEHENQAPNIYVNYLKKLTSGTTSSELFITVSDPDGTPQKCDAESIFSEITFGDAGLKSTSISGTWPKCKLTMELNTAFTGSISGFLWASDGTSKSILRDFSFSISPTQTATPTPTATKVPTDPKLIEAALAEYVQTGVPDEKYICVATLKEDHNHMFFNKVRVTLKTGEKYAGRPDILAEYFSLYKFTDSAVNYILIDKVPAQKIAYNCTYAKFKRPTEANYEIAQKDLIFFSDPEAKTKACTVRKGTSRKNNIYEYDFSKNISTADSVYIWEVKLNSPSGECATAQGPLYYKRDLSGENEFVFNGVTYDSVPEIVVHVKD
jgi:hypothetical protein